MRFHLPALNHDGMDPVPANHGTRPVLTGLLDRSALYGVGSAHARAANGASAASKVGGS